MNTRNKGEHDLNLKWLLYRILRAWRGIVLVALVIGAVAFSVSLISGLVTISDADYIVEAESDYQREHAAWVATGENYEAQIENIVEEREAQAEYNEKSILMQIDPLREFNASMEIYVDYDYRIMPNMSYQNADLSNRILKAYATYMTNGDLYQYVIDNLSYPMEHRYLSEILTLNVDYNNKMLSFSVKQQNEDLCKELLGLIEAAINTKYESVNDTIAEHELAVTNSVVYEAVNLSLQEEQKANKQAISDLDIALQETYTSYLAWKKQPEPQPEYTNIEIIKSAVKVLILGCLVGGFLMVCMALVEVILSGKLKNPEDVTDCFGLRLLGELPGERVKKPFAFISRWFCRFGGITRKPEDYDAIARMVGANIKADINAGENTEGWNKIVFAGTVNDEELTKLVSATGLGDSYTLVKAPELLSSPDSVEALSNADCVVLVEKQEVSFFSDIEKEVEMLNAWKKSILGVVVLNTDAVM